MESSPKGTKAQILKRKYPDCIIPELPPDVSRREEIINATITSPSYIVGSSLGGLSAILFAMKHPDLVKGMILLAPAVGSYVDGIFTESDRETLKKTFIPAGIPAAVIVGTRDDVIPLDSVLEMIERSPEKESIEFVKLEDDHSLNRYPDEMLDRLEKLMASDRFCSD